jgi:sporulation protein YlmC with PRC-barrel domain
MKLSHVSMLAVASSLMFALPAAAQTTTPPATTPPATAPSATAPAPQAVQNIPAQSVAMSDFYRQSVYDKANEKIGDISDVLFDGSKKASLAIIGVGGFLGIGEKNVAVPFESIQRTVRDGKVYLTMDANKDQLKAAQGLRYDRVTNSWMADTAANDSAPANRPTNMPTTR